MIEFFVDEMHGTAGNLYAVGESLFLRFESGKGREERRMDVENPPRELLHEPGREQPHVSGKADQINFVLLERRDNLSVMILSRFALGWNHHRIQSASARSGDARCVCIVRDDDANARIDDAARVDAVGDGDEVRAASGEENTEGMHASSNDNPPRRHGENLKIVNSGGGTATRVGPQHNKPQKFSPWLSASVVGVLLILVVDDFALALDDAADGVSFFTHAFEHCLGFLEFRQGDDRQHAQAHVEGAQHLFLRNIA